jgi:hypothetical protein
VQRSNPSPLWFSNVGGVLTSLATSYLATGAGAPGHAPVAGGLYVPGIAEFDGAAYCDSTLGVTGALSAAGGIVLTGSISSLSNANVNITPNGTGITTIGDAVAYAFTTPVNDDLSVSGRLGVKGLTYLAGTTVAGDFTTTSSGYARLSGSVYLITPNTVLFTIENYNAGNGNFNIVAGGCMNLAIGMTAAYTRGNFAITSDASGCRAVTYSQAASLDPTFRIFSRTAAATSTARWISRCHNTADGVDSTGLGGHILSPFSGAVYLNKATATQKDFALTTFDSEITLSVAAAETATGIVASAVFGAAEYVTVEITGLDAADHSISLGTTGTPAMLCTVSQGAADDHIHVGKNAFYSGVPIAPGAELKLTIAGGGDNIPTAGKVHVTARYSQQIALTA